MIEWLASLDMSVLQSLYAARSDTFVQILMSVSTVGDTATVIVLAAVLAFIFYIYKRHAEMAGLVTAVIGTASVTYVLKHLVQRARPDALYQAYAETGYSFPSGHASASAALYGFLAFLAWRNLKPGINRTALATLAIAFALLISFSRLYLGVHYLSDVVAGSIVGMFFAWLGSKVTRTIRNPAAS